MTGKDCEQHGLEYYDGGPEKDGKDEGTRSISGQHLLEKFITRISKERK